MKNRSTLCSGNTSEAAMSNVISLKSSTLLSLRRPPLFRLAGKEGEEKGRWVTFGAYRLCVQAGTGYDRTHIAPSHPTKSDYAPPVISASNLIAVTFQYLQKIRTANKIYYAVRIRIGLPGSAGKIQENRRGFCDADPVCGLHRKRRNKAIE